MKNRIWIVTAILSIFVLMLGTASLAQENSPEIIGNPDSEALAIVQNYLNTRDVNLLNENVQVSDTAMKQDYQGRDSARAVYEQYYNGTFTDVTTEPTRFIVSGQSTEGTDQTAEVVVAEYNVNGVNTGDIGQNPATNTEVSIPTVSIFTVEGGSITEIDTFYDQASLEEQLGLMDIGYNIGYMDSMMTQAESTMESPQATPMDSHQDPMNSDMTEEIDVNPDMIVTATPLGGIPTGEVPETEVAVTFTPTETTSLDAVLDDPDSYYGQYLAIEADLVETVNDRIFMLQDNDLINADQLRIVYVADAAPSADIAALADEDANVRITGTLQQFSLENFRHDYVVVDLTDDGYADWDGQPVLVADSLTVVGND